MSPRALGQACLGLWLLPAASVLGQPSGAETPIPRASLCETEGSLVEASGAKMSVRVPKMRAYANVAPSDSVELRFTYEGPTENRAPLASGATRVQLGLKLRAADGCNLVYVMWRVEPTPGLVVSVKSNQGQHSSAECGNHGYHDIKAEFTGALPRLKPGDTHRLSAAIQADELRAFLDGQLVWRGHLPAEALRLKGPGGIRTDNAKLTFEIREQTVPGAVQPPIAGSQCVSATE